jgi:uncharacterized sulfatase
VSKTGTTCDEPVLLGDLYYTLLAAAGRPQPTEARDGLDLSPLLKDPAARLDRDALYFHYPHYYHTTTPVSAIRARDWKLLEFFEDNHLELYNLHDDLSEKHNLAAQMPEKAAELRDKLHAWRESVGAALPRPNPDYKGVPPKPRNSQVTP